MLHVHRLVLVWLAGFALGAGVARAETAIPPFDLRDAPGSAAAAPAPPPDVASLRPAPARDTLAALRALVANEARHLGAEVCDTIARSVARASREHGIPSFLLVALIAQESGFDPSAENGGAIGLMQVRPFVARDYAERRGLRWRGEASLRDPAHNVQLASGYLGELLDRFDSLDLALAAYNKGPEAVKRDLREDLTPRPRFVEDVLRRYERYSERYGGI